MSIKSTDPETHIPWWNSNSPWLWIVVFAVTLVAYWPALGAGYIWDDSGHVTRNDLLSFGGLARIWFEPGATQQYYPFLHSAFWFEHHLWGAAPLGYHLLNVLLHAIGACLFATVLRQLAIPGAWLAAFLFALHPVAVESVAWISEQKNTLSTVLFLCAALAYLRFDTKRRLADYIFASCLFVLALCTKTVSATLPAGLLVVLWWQRGGISWRRDVIPLAPWFVLGAIGGLVTAWAERTLIGASGSTFHLDFVERCLIAGRVIWFYLGKLVWPTDLIFVYPRWKIDSSALGQYLFPIAAVVLLLGCWFSGRRGLLAAILFFVGSLFPALGFVNVFPFIYSFVADHFQYLADLGIWALVAAVGAAFLSRASRWTSGAIVAVVFVGLGALTWHQTLMYRDVFTLYETTLAKNPAAWMAHTNLAIALADSGRVADAIPHYEAALKLRPNYAEGENNLGYALNTLGHPDFAIPHLQRSIQLNPTYADPHNNLGIALMNSGRAAEGQTEFETALRLNALYPEAHLNLGLALANSGRTSEAIAHFAEAVRLRPDYAEAEMNWGIGLTLSDRFDEAFSHFHRALEIKPDDPSAHTLFGRSLARAGKLEEAISQYRMAIELNPNSAEAHSNLGFALRQLGRSDEAAQEFQEANRLAGR